MNFTHLASHTAAVHVRIQVVVVGRILAVDRTLVAADRILVAVDRMPVAVVHTLLLDSVLVRLEKKETSPLTQNDKL